MPGEVENFITEAMECPVCTQVYERPKQLHCGHSLCSHCVDRLMAVDSRHQGLGGIASHSQQVSISISCPVCRHCTTVPPSGLPVNYALCELISRFNTAQELKRPCSMCSKSVMCESQMYCTTCTNDSNMSTVQDFLDGDRAVEMGSRIAQIMQCVLCVMCALKEHSQKGHTVEQVEPALENARRDAIQHINEVKDSAALCVSQWEAAIESLVPTVIGFTDSATNQLSRFDLMVNELEQMDVCPIAVSSQKTVRAERLGRAFSEMARKVTWMQNVREQVRRDVEAMETAFDLAEFGEVSIPGQSTNGNLQDLTISESPEEGPSTGSGVAFTRNTPPARPIEAVRQRRCAAMARRRARHVVNSPPHPPSPCNPSPLTQTPVDF